MKISPIVTPRAPSEVKHHSSKPSHQLQTTQEMTMKDKKYVGLENIQEKDEFVNIKLFLKNEPSQKKKHETSGHNSFLDSQNSTFGNFDIKRDGVAKNNRREAFSANNNKSHRSHGPQHPLI